MNGLALCVGVGMLDEGLRAGFEFLGIPYRTACYVEREAYPAAQLIARMEEGALDAAPVWSDITTFNGAAWRGKLDCLTAGFPCQPHSVAGKRAGLSDERWIWPSIVDIIRASGVWLVWLENVPGLASTGGLASCLEDLSALGFDAVWGVLAAGQTGASHKRDRLFILAYSRLQHQHLQQWQVRAQHPGGDGSMANTSRREFQEPGRRSQGRSGSGSASDSVLGNADCQREQQPDNKDGSESWQGARVGTGRSGSIVADTSCVGLLTRGSADGEHDRAVADANSKFMADAHSTRSQGRRNDTGKHPHQWTSWAGGLGLFAPGPSDPRWQGIIENFPHLAPAVEPGICCMVDGVAVVVDESRADQLRAIGNGVVPLQAATAFVLLARRAGLFGQGGMI